MEAYAEKHAEEQRRYLGAKALALQALLPGQSVSSTLLEGYVTEALERQAEADRRQTGDHDHPRAHRRESGLAR